MKLLTILSLFLLPLLAGAQPPVKKYDHGLYPIRTRKVASLKDSTAKYNELVAAYKRLSGFAKTDSVAYKCVHLHDSAQVIATGYSQRYEDSVFHAKMKQ